MTLNDNPKLLKILKGVDLSALTPTQLKTLGYCSRLSNCVVYRERLNQPAYLPIAKLIEKIYKTLRNEAEKLSEFSVEKYEYARTIAANRKVVATRTRRAAERWGWRTAVENAVVKNVKVESSGFQMLLKTGYLECSYENFIIQHPEYFSDDVIAIAKNRLKAAGFFK